MAVLRENLLAGRCVAFSPSGAAAVAALLVDLGAEVGDPGADPDTAFDAVVHDLRPAFGGGGTEALLDSLQQAWEEIAQVVNSALIGSGAGKVVLIAPPAEAGEAAPAARAALENLARTLSVEWARYGITVTAIAPAGGTREEDVAVLTAYLLSAAGDYFTGCRFDLGPR